jgi:hypothetical protein
VMGNTQRDELNALDDARKAYIARLFQVLADDGDSEKFQKGLENSRYAYATARSIILNTAVPS